MPYAEVAPDVTLHYLIDDYTDPWRDSDAVLLLHGAAESGAVWFGWVPTLARSLCVVRPDMRGFGRSTAMARDFPWSLDTIVDDYLALMSGLGFARFHLVGAKLGGTIARHFAARHPELVCTLTVAGTPAPRRIGHAATREALIAEFEQKGSVEGWARRTMKGRLGKDFPDAGVEWWIQLMARTPVSTQIGFASTISLADITDDLPRIACPTLVITTEGSALGSVEATRAWQTCIPNSRLLVLPGDSYHVAASHADRCARETLAFINQA